MPETQRGTVPKSILDPAPETHTNPLTRRNFLLGSAAATAAGMALYSSEFARHELSILTRTLSVANLPEAFHNYRVVQISDIHFDEYTEPEFLRRVVAQVNTLHADLLLLTGDFISYGPLPLSFAAKAVYQCADILRGLTCPLRFGIMGNHDSNLGYPLVSDALSHAGVPILYNDYVPIERGGQRLWLCGVADPAAGQPNLHLAIPAQPDCPVLLMCHGPDYADIVVNHPRGHLVDLMFSGHTHGGQVRLPIIGPTILPPWGKKYVEGLFRFDRLQLYVNRGIGTVGLPLRLNCPPEISVFMLQDSGGQRGTAKNSHEQIKTEGFSLSSAALSCS